MTGTSQAGNTIAGTMLQLALEASVSGTILTDRKGIVTFINPVARTLLRKTSNERLLHLRDILPVAADLLDSCQGPSDCRAICTTSGGKPLRLTVTPLVENDEHLGFVCDLQQEDTSRRQLDAIFNSSTDGFWLADGHGVILNVNAAAARNSRFEPSELIGKTIYQVLEEGYISRSAVAQALKTKKQSSVLEHKPFSGKTLLITASPVFDDAGELSLIVANERDITQLNSIREDLERSRQELKKIREELGTLNLREMTGKELVAESGAMLEVLDVAFRLARSGVSNILINGESGTGKGVLAKFIHSKSEREKEPFIHINCAALPQELLEAELFGYEKGAFTSASAQGKAGLIELAHGGTLFLDEIGDMPLALQAKLLKYLDDHEVLRLGSTHPITVDCTIIAATNQNLKYLAKEKRFRPDLYYRLNGFMVKLPPLRSRPDDVLALATHYLNTYNAKYKRSEKFSQEMRRCLLSYPFPGNVRELKNIVKRIVLIGEAELLEELAPAKPKRSSGPEFQAEGFTGMAAAVAATERKVLEMARMHCRTTREMAAFLKVSQAKVVRDLKKYGLS